MPPKPKKKQQVRFAETATVVVVRKCNYHYENWYRKGEVRAFKRDIEKACLAKADPYSKVMKSVGYCVQQGTVSPNFAVEDEIRGLEHLLSPSNLVFYLWCRDLQNKPRNNIPNHNHDAAYETLQ